MSNEIEETEVISETKLHKEPIKITGGTKLVIEVDEDKDIARIDIAGNAGDLASIALQLFEQNPDLVDVFDIAVEEYKSKHPLYTQG